MSTDADALQRALAKRFSKLSSDEDYGWPSPPLNVLDCILSLNRHYDRFCLPRVQRFAECHPNVNTLRALKRLIESYPSPLAFSVTELDYRDGPRAQTLVAVTNFLLAAQKSFTGKTESARLRQWARTVLPEDWKKPQIRGFGLSGFQYLRMLFGAQTTKPDVHIRRYVSGVLGRPVTDVRALALLEESAERLKLPLRSVDRAIWNHSARKKATSRPRGN